MNIHFRRSESINIPIKQFLKSLIDVAYNVESRKNQHINIKKYIGEFQRSDYLTCSSVGRAEATKYYGRRFESS